MTCRRVFFVFECFSFLDCSRLFLCGWEHVTWTRYLVLEWTLYYESMTTRPVLLACSQLLWVNVVTLRYYFSCFQQDGSTILSFSNVTIAGHVHSLHRFKCNDSDTLVNEFGYSILRELINIFCLWHPVSIVYVYSYLFSFTSIRKYEYTCYWDLLN